MENQTRGKNFIKVLKWASAAQSRHLVLVTALWDFIFSPTASLHVDWTFCCFSIITAVRTFSTSECAHTHTHTHTHTQAYTVELLIFAGVKEQRMLQHYWGQKYIIIVMQGWAWGNRNSSILSSKWRYIYAYRRVHVGRQAGGRVQGQTSCVPKTKTQSKVAALTIWHKMNGNVQVMCSGLMREMANRWAGGRGRSGDRNGGKGLHQGRWGEVEKREQVSIQEAWGKSPGGQEEIENMTAEKDQEKECDISISTNMVKYAKQQIYIVLTVALCILLLRNVAVVHGSHLLGLL